VSNGIVYVGSYDNNVYAIDATTGIEKWLFKVGGEVMSLPTVSNGVVYVGSWDNNLYAIGGMSSSQVNSQTIASAQTVDINRTATTTVESNLIYVALLVFLILFGAILYTYYKKKK
jgi:outer membrane protein assembly factor BamB